MGSIVVTTEAQAHSGSPSDLRDDHIKLDNQQKVMNKNLLKVLKKLLALENVKEILMQMAANSVKIKGRQAIASAMSATQLLLFAGYLITVAVFSLIKCHKKRKEQIFEVRMDEFEERLAARKSKRRSAGPQVRQLSEGTATVE